MTAGVWAAGLTPLHADLSIDAPLMAQHVTTLLANGCDGVVIFGTTGEAPSFSVAERRQALEELVLAGINPQSLMVGTGTTAITDTVELSAHAGAVGVAGVLVLPPFYFKDPTRAGLVAGFRAVLDQTPDDLALYLYHFPRLSTVPIQPGLIEELRSSHGSRVAGVKDSSGEIGSMQAFSTVNDFAVFGGTERLLVENIRLGGAGVITATANVEAPLIARVRDEEAAGTRADDRTMLAVRTVYERHGAIPAMKATLADRQGHNGWLRVRPPLVSLGADARLRLLDDLEAIARQD